MAAYFFETGVYRPPSEGGSSSLLIRFTRNCPWNRCTFCGMYKTKKFQVRSVEEIKQDIDAMAVLCSDLKHISQQTGHGSIITHEAAVELIRQNPSLNYHEGFAMIFQWLLSGAQTAFVQDANSLIMKTDQLVEVLQYLRSTFPSISRVTSYARSKTLMQKSLDELTIIRQAGLDRVHVGLESGDDTVLKRVKKGVTAQGHIRGGQKAIQAGFQLSAYWMPGLGGKALWKQHAENTAQVLSIINPHYIRSRPIYPLPGTPLHEQISSGEFQTQTPQEQLLELQQTISALEVTSKVCFDHAGNYWKDSCGEQLFTLDYEGYQFPDNKQMVLDRIQQGLSAKNRQPMVQRL